MEKDSVGTATVPTDDVTSNENQDAYIGVLLVHGIGEIPRNATLQQVINALMSWWIDKAKLELRPEGDGRLWLTTHLTNSVSPDAPPSRATLDLVAPAGTSSGITNEGTNEALAQDRSCLHLQLREIWWAEPFAQVSIGTTIQWARLQFLQEAAHLLLPIGRHLGPAQRASKAPAQYTPQALTYRPLLRDTSQSGTRTNATSVAGGKNGTSFRRGFAGQSIRIALAVYGIVQYIWKAVQWAALTPLIVLLLLAMGAIRVLVFLPFTSIQSGVVNWFSALTTRIMLHWVAPMWVYLTDFTRSAAIRQRFVRELEDLEKDNRCERIVVIAHSMGVVIAYEGLTTKLAAEQGHAPSWAHPALKKPIDFLCLGQALRRAWLLAGIDQHRLRVVLHKDIRWVNFWARYDPIAAGPLGPDSLPSMVTADGQTAPDPDTDLRNRLKDCENVDVVNTDSIFQDHLAYWDNVEQFVGPIALELVRDHPRLKQRANECQASSKDIVLRRWHVAMRAMLTLLTGLCAGAVSLFLDLNGIGLGHLIESVLGLIQWQHIVCSNFGFNTNACLDWLSVGPTVPNLAPPLIGFGIALAIVVVSILNHPDPIFTIGTALVVLSIVMFVVGQRLAQPSPLALRKAAAEVSPGSRSTYVLAGLSFVFVAVALVLSGPSPEFQFSYFPLTLLNMTDRTTSYTWVSGLAELLGSLAVAAGLYAAWKKRQWTWLVALLLSVFMVASEDPRTPGTVYTYFSRTFEVAFIVVAITGCIRLLIFRARIREWRGFTALLGLSLLLLYTTLGSVFYGYTSIYDPSAYANLARNVPLLITTGFPIAASFLPALTYGIWMRLAPARVGRTYRKVLLGSFVLALGALLAYSLLVLILSRPTTVPLVQAVASVPLTPVYRWGDLSFVGVVNGTAYGLGTLVWALCLVDASRSRRWLWLVVFGFVGLSAVLVLCGFIVPSLSVLVLGPFASALTYILWAGPAEPLVERGIGEPELRQDAQLSAAILTGAPGHDRDKNNQSM